MDINFTLLNTFGIIVIVFSVAVLWIINSRDEDKKSSNRKIMDNNKS